MEKPIKEIIIVGGGSAGWITAGTIAAEHCTDASSTVRVTLIESPVINSIGVGEGTWPSMRHTLDKIGIDEKVFLQQCDASFKQGSKFINWKTGTDDYYYHPFSLPQGFNTINLAKYWQPSNDQSLSQNLALLMRLACKVASVTLV